VIRQPVLAAERRDGEPIANWVVVTQQPAPRQRVPIGAVITVTLRPGGTPRALASAPGAADEAAAARP